MKRNYSRIERLEELLTPKTQMTVMIDYAGFENESWLEINHKKYMIPPEVKVKEFIDEKIKSVKDVSGTLHLAKDRTQKPNADFSNLISKGDCLIEIK